MIPAKPEEDFTEKEIIVNLEVAVDLLEQENQRLEHKLAKAEKVIVDFNLLISDSEGVTGLHLNGCIAEWDWLMENEWLESLKDYEASKE